MPILENLARENSFYRARRVHTYHYSFVQCVSPIDKNLKPVFRITPLAHPDLDEILADAGFAKKDISSVQVMDLVSFRPQATGEIRHWAEFSQD